MWCGCRLISISATRSPHVLFRFSHSFPLCFSLTPSLSHLSLFLDKVTVVNSVIDLNADSIYNLITSSVAGSPTAPPRHMLFLQLHFCCHLFAHLLIFQHFLLTSAALPFGLRFCSSKIWLIYLSAFGLFCKDDTSSILLKAFVVVLFRLCILPLRTFVALCPSQWRSVEDWIQPPVSLWRCLGGWRTSGAVNQMSHPPCISSWKRECRYAAKPLMLWQYQCTITYHADKAH